MDPELNVQLSNFPPSGTEGEMRTLVLGPVGPMTLLVQSTYNDTTEAVDISITMSNVCENDRIVETLGEMIELLTTIRDNAQPEVDAALAASSSDTEKE